MSLDLRPTLVVGYDGSASSYAALCYAALRASRCGRVVVVHAYELPRHGSGWPQYGRELAERHDAASPLLDDLPLGSQELAGPDYERELIGGDPAHAIANAARAYGADEIIVGAGGRGNAQVELGSVSHALINLADRPVVVIPGVVVALPLEPVEVT